MTGDRDRATRFAARLGRGFAGYGMIGFGGLILLGVTAALITAIWLDLHRLLPRPGGARGRGPDATLIDRIEGLRVADVMDAEPVAIPER